MQYALSINGQRVSATKGDRASCPQCHSDVIAKCGEIVAHHWAHESTLDCDNWWEPESPWHRWWKEGLDPERVEVTMGPHRADIQRTNGTVVELQHSQISPEEIMERESFYGDMVWIFDGTNINDGQLDLRPKGSHVTFRWKHPRKHYACPTKPVYIDLGESLLHLKKLHLEKPPYGGWGYRVLKEAMRSWVHEQQTCATCAHGIAHANEKGHLNGFVHCDLVPLWQWRSGSSPCQLEPQRWLPATAPILSMR